MNNDMVFVINNKKSANMRKNTTILYIEDDKDTRKVYSDFFKRRVSTS